MITVTVHRDEEGDISSFCVDGHSGYADPGEDIVCAAVSALSQTAVLGLETVLGLKPEVTKKDGYLAVAVDQPKTCRVLLETMVLGLKDVAGTYPRHVKVLDEGPPKGVNS